MSKKRRSAAELAAEGLCISCGRRPPEDGRRQCTQCIEYLRNYRNNVSEDTRQSTVLYLETGEAIDVSEISEMEARLDKDVPEGVWTLSRSIRAHMIWIGRNVNGLMAVEDKREPGRYLLLMNQTYLTPVWGEDGIIACEWRNRSDDSLLGYRDLKAGMMTYHPMAT